MIPLIITIIARVGNSNANKIKNIQKLELIESKIIVDNTEWKNSFDCNGNYLTPVNLFINSDNYKVTTLCKGSSNPRLSNWNTLDNGNISNLISYTYKRQ